MGIYGLRVVACLEVSFLLWAVAHAEACQVSITEGEENHEDDEETVMMEVNGQVESRLNITQHEKGDEDHAAQDGHRKYHAVFARLEIQTTDQLIHL